MLLKHKICHGFAKSVSHQAQRKNFILMVFAILILIKGN